MTVAAVRRACSSSALALALALTGCGSGTSERDAAVETLVRARGMDPEVAECTVTRLEQRGIELETLGDGRVDPAANPEVVEAVAACSVAVVADAES